jgi:hypothetical protein
MKTGITTLKSAGSTKIRLTNQCNKYEILLTQNIETYFISFFGLAKIT